MHRERKCAENYNWHNNFFSETAISFLVISNHKSFRVLFDKIASAYFIGKMYWYFSVGNGQSREPVLCHLCRRTSVPYWCQWCVVCVCVWYIGASTQLRVCSTVGIVAGVFGLVISVVLAIIIAYLWWDEISLYHWRRQGGPRPPSPNCRAKKIFFWLK